MRGGLSQAATASDKISWRRNLWALWFAQMLAIVGFSLRVPFLPFYLADLGAGSTDQQALWAGIVNAAGAGVMAVSAPFWGVISDRRGRKPMLLRAMFAACCTVGLMGFATRPWHLLALRLVEGGLTGTVTAATALVASTTPKERLGFGLGMISTAVFSGSSLGPLIGGVLADQIGYRATFGVSAAMLGSSGLLVLFLVREHFVRAPAGTAKGRRAALRAAADLMLGRVMLTLILTLLVVRFASSAVQPIIPLYVEQLAHKTGDAVRGASTLSGLTLGILGLTSAVAALYFGRLGDRIGHRRILVWCTLGAGLLYLPMAAAGAPWHLIALQGLFGVAAGGLVPAANALIAAVTTAERRGAVFGLTAAAASLGGFFGPLAGAGLAASLGFPATFLTTAALLLALTAGLAAAFATDRRRPEDAPAGAPG